MSLSVLLDSFGTKILFVISTYIIENFVFVYFFSNLSLLKLSFLYRRLSKEVSLKYFVIQILWGRMILIVCCFLSYSFLSWQLSSRNGKDLLSFEIFFFCQAKENITLFMGHRPGEFFDISQLQTEFVFLTLPQ